jgi:hypothetical protein
VLIDLILRIESSEIQIILKFRKGFDNKKISYFPYLFLGPKSRCAAPSAHFPFFFSFPFLFQHAAHSEFWPVLNHQPAQPPPSAVAQLPQTAQPASPNWFVHPHDASRGQAKRPHCRLLCTIAPGRRTDLHSAHMRPCLPWTPSSCVHPTATLSLRRRL